MNIHIIKAENDLLKEQIKRLREENEKLIKANINLRNQVINPKKSA